MRSPSPHAQHPWLIGGADGVGEVGEGVDPEGSEVVQNSLDTVHEMMRRFNAERRWRRAARVVIACRRFRLAGRGDLRIVSAEPSDTAGRVSPSALAVSGWARDDGDDDADAGPFAMAEEPA